MMKLRMILRDTVTGKYYSGSNYEPTFSYSIDEAETFYSFVDIEDVINDDHLKQFFELKKLSITTLLIGERYNDLLL